MIECNFSDFVVHKQKLLLTMLTLYCLPCSQGGKAGAVQKCVACRGRGMRIMIRQLAPGMVQQMQSVCTDCNGEGNMSINSPHSDCTFLNQYL